ncbi:uncharacterized protein LOC102715220 [Oryza brachyantha]|uniref:GCK domain-containing protein n=1 Tax=Oryza brachyantha TaxID=4533 RepID=J3MIN8_ORYBR|nr:uncharacterized protein LOC102715220 [Oryza brachyantha]
MAVTHPEGEPAAGGEQPVVEGAAAVDAEEKEAAEGEGEEEEDEEGECGFCLYMKGGGCRDAFVAWEECVEAARGSSDMVERCFEATASLRRCMDAHADYYGPVLRAEQAVNDHADAAIADEDKQAEPPPPASTGENKVDAVVQEAAPAAGEKKQEVDDRSAASSVAAIDERKEEEVVTEKSDS